MITSDEDGLSHQDRDPSCCTSRRALCLQIRDNVDFKSYMFNTACRRADESLDDFATWMRKLVTYYEFDRFDNEAAIRLRIIEGCHSTGFRTKVLKETYRQDKILTISRGVEMKGRGQATKHGGRKLLELRAVSDSSGTTGGGRGDSPLPDRLGWGPGDSGTRRGRERALGGSRQQSGAARADPWAGPRGGVAVQEGTAGAVGTDRLNWSDPEAPRLPTPAT
ncbi:hypothetical protein NDU88_008408 [Pleurodeles waltl]|uniref:Uncharacterized protein n=1 Tax=Pleurodeles waltl TaxID=8319 RepID=A0AAV7RTQ4_PLEWA|nr:hypothetical protein NDU88_008408 [Pleurodeles waltl]